jgi:hypothetical protein
MPCQGRETSGRWDRGSSPLVREVLRSLSPPGLLLGPVVLLARASRRLMRRESTPTRTRSCGRNSPCIDRTAGRAPRWLISGHRKVRHKRHP